MGGILGHHEDEMKELAMKKVLEIKRQMQKLISKHLPAQYALILLRICVEGKFRFLARTTPPEILRKAAAVLDSAKLEVYLKLCGILPFELDDRPDIEDQIFRPITLGGRGLSRFSAILDISFVASQAMCASLIRTRLRERTRTAGTLAS
jgi:hypothetical protein